MSVTLRKIQAANDDDWGNKVVKVVVEIDQDRARQLGVTSEEVTRLLNTYFTGTAVSIYREGDNAIPIVLRAGAYTSQSLEGLTSATFAKNGGLISLAQVARLKPGFDLARIRRKNQGNRHELPPAGRGAGRC